MMMHRLATLAITLAVLIGVAIGAFAWRLSQGPVDLPWLTSRLEEAANAEGGPTRLTIGSVALTWEGFRLGVDRPLDLRLTDVVLIDQSGGNRMRIPRAEVSLSLHQLLLGRVALRAVALDGPQLRLRRAADGTLSLDLGSFTESADTGEPPQPTEAKPVAELLAELARPLRSDRDRGPGSLLGQLRVVRIRDAQVALVDRQIGVTWRAPQAAIDLTRRPQGGIDGTADLSLALGVQQARLTASATLAAGATETHLRARLSAVTPSSLAGMVPALASLDAPVETDAALDLDANLAVRSARLTLRAGAGAMRIGATSVPIVDAVLVASGTPRDFALQTLRVGVIGHTGGPETHIDARGTVRRDADKTSATLSLDLDQVDFADLSRLWPEGAVSGARSWIVENIPAGIARNGHFDVGLAAGSDLSSVALTSASGTLDGDGLQVHWLRPIPPIDNGQAQLRILDPDTLEIVVASGRQMQRNQRGGLQIRGGRMRITGIMQAHQVATINAEIAGPVPDAIALLREPRLALLDRHPIDLKDPAGQATVKLTLGVPLELNVTLDSIAIRAQAHLEGVHLGAIAAGRDLDQGVLDLDANPDGLKVNGRALLASIPARLNAAMDFRAGPPSQVVQTVTVSGQPDAGQLAAAGLDTTSLLSGPVQVQGTLTERRNGQGELAVAADMTSAELAVAPLGWRKPRNVPAKASARVVLDHDRLTGIDTVQVDGEGLTMRGRADARDGRIVQVQIDRLMLGRTVAQGTIRMGGSAPIAASFNGATIDLAQRFAQKAPTHPPQRPTTEPPPGPRWTLDARFDRALMADGKVFGDMVLHAENDGRVTRQLRLDGNTALRTPFQVQIAPDGSGRRVSATAADAGELLHGLDYVRSIQGGRLSVDARYDDAQPGRPLTGTATIEDFRVRGAPALAKLLQAMTLYGLIEVMQGPGLGFTRLVAPFRLTDEALDLADARAFSSSLGLTAKGRIELDAQQLDMQGTIVPAYFFNALLGNIPLVGKLFSPERGGGVFAASYTLHGPMADPEVFVNPLTALTPGFLRGLFGIF
jgi:hypothetical protein